MTQLINQGYLEIAFHENNKLKLTPFAKEVLFKGKKVALANLVEAEKVLKEQKVKTEPLLDNNFQSKIPL